MRRAVTFVAIAAAKTLFKETFDDKWQDRWVVSDWKQSAGQAGEFKHTAGDYFGDAEADKGLQTSQDARFYDISAQFPEFSNKGEDLVIQFSVKNTQHIDCGGGYLKVFPAGLDQKHMTGDSDYNVMFGPDVCGQTKRVHVIFTNKGKNHLIKKTIACESDQLTHVYTLIVRPDNTYEVRIDGNKKESGSLADDWDILPPKKIKDPSQSKPSDWIDNEQMDDPTDVKPEGYDDIPKQIVDPDASKPDDWDTDADGEWEAPTIDNPAFKGPWKVKKIPNPDYRGVWVHPEIDNPEYAPDSTLYSYESFGAVGIDVWQVKSGTIFDNVLITNSVDEAESFLAETYTKNKDAEKSAFDAAEKKRTDAEEESRKAAEEERKKSAAAEEEEDEDKPKVEL